MLFEPREAALVHSLRYLPSALSNKWRGLLAGCSIGQLPFYYIAGFVGWTSCHLCICSFGVASQLTDLFWR